MTFRQALRRTWITFTAPLVIAVLAAYVVMTLAGVQPDPGTLNLERTPDGPSYAQQLAAEHQCWTSEAPAGEIPGHALVETNPADGPRIAPADTGFDIWVGPDQTADTGDELAGTVLAFCP